MGSFPLLFLVLEFAEIQSKIGLNLEPCKEVYFMFEKWPSS